MLQHYLKIAFRNLLKYKTQTLISIIGLAVGFTCFALATMWIHYEMTYDTYHKDSDRISLLYGKNVFDDTGYATGMPYPTSTQLKKDYPEVEDACAYMIWDNTELRVEGSPAIDTQMMLADSCFMKMFDVRLLSGNMDFLHSDEQIALTEDIAKQLWGSTDVLGKELTVSDRKQTVCAILKGYKHSNFSFGCWGQGAYFHQWQNDWSYGSFSTCIKLRKGISATEFQNKLVDSQFKEDPRMPEPFFKKVRIIPLNEYRYSEINGKMPIKFQYLMLFSVIGGLVILCSLFNYLSLFITRMEMRCKELELRRVCGSSIGGILSLYMVEYSIMILLAGILGMTLIELVLPVFREMSRITGNIYVESLYYFAGLLLLSFVLLFPFALRRTPKGMIRRRLSLYRCSILFQIFISILFIFCMSVLFKQLYYLTLVDLGWERKNIATFSVLYPKDNYDEIAEKIDQMPSTAEVLKDHFGIFPTSARLSLHIKAWDGKTDEAEELNILSLMEGKKIADFYHLKLLKGEMIKEEDTDKAVINEAAAKALGMDEPIGKCIYSGENIARRIIGVVKDFHTTAPTIPVKPTMFIGEKGISLNVSFGKGDILVRYHDGKWLELKSEVDRLFSQTYPNVRYQFINIEDKYAEFLKSENMLMKLLSFVSIVCILIAAFGIFSLVTLSCEQHRKEIAIRKVNGARIIDILMRFAKEYLSILFLASVTAFPLGYVFMKQWLESYVEQTHISFWIFFIIFVGIAFVITLSIGWRVWQAARQNPAEVIKSE